MTQYNPHVILGPNFLREMLKIQRLREQAALGRWAQSALINGMLDDLEARYESERMAESLRRHSRKGERDVRVHVINPGTHSRARPYTARATQQASGQPAATPAATAQARKPESIFKGWLKPVRQLLLGRE
jgi:hypothetical protein